MTDASTRAWDGVLGKRHGKKLKGTTADAPPTSAGTETADQIEARVRAEEQQRQKDIVAVCDLAGQAARAASFIGNGTSLSDTLATLARAASSRPKG